MSLRPETNTKDTNQDTSKAMSGFFMVPASDPSDLGVTSYTKLSEGNFNTQIYIVTGPLCRHIQKLNMDR